MTTDTIRESLTSVGFNVIECDAEPNGLFLVTVRAVKWGNATMLSKCNRAGLALERYGNLRGIDYMYLRPVAERLL